MKMDRMISLIMILLERKKVSIPELAKICEVTPRTIQRDLDAINMAGVPIVSYPGVGGGVGIMENYKLEKRLFTTADVTTLLMGLGSIRTSLTGGEVASALMKLRGMIPEESREAIELKAGQITIDTTPWVGKRDYGELLTLLQQAMDERRLVRFSYSDRLTNKSKRTVEPYRLILKSMNWYFEGFCLEREAFRIFKLSRVLEATLLDESYAPRPFSPRQTIEPRFADKNQVSATLRVREAAVEPLIEDYGLEHMEQAGDDTWIAQVTVLGDERGYKFLLSLGADCEVLAPDTLRTGFKAYVENILAQYAAAVEGVGEG